MKKLDMELKIESDSKAKWMIRFGPYLLSLILPIYMVTASNAQQVTNADDLIPGLIATDHWTPFYWGQSRLGSLIPFITIPIDNLSLNLLMQNIIHIWFLIIFAIFIIEKLFSIHSFIAKCIPLFLTMLAVLLFWPKEYMSGLPFGDSFGLTSIAFHVAFDIFSSKKRLPFIVASVFPLALANWVNPLVSIYFLPAYICLFICLRRFRKEIILLFTISSIIGLGFVGYGVEAGEIRGLSSPSFSAFNNFYPFLPLMAIQLISIPLLYFSKRSQTIRYKFFYTFSSLLAWPITLLISMLNHVKVSEYAVRYFIPIITISFVIQVIVFIDDLVSKIPRSPKALSPIKLLKKNSNLIAIFFIIGALLINIILFSNAKKIFPLEPTWQKVNAKAIQIMPNPQFIIGDYWFSWPMKLFLSAEETIPILSYRMEGQKIFNEKNRESLNYALGNGAKGICFGSVIYCQGFLDSIPGYNSFDKSLTLLSEDELKFNGQEINFVRIKREMAKERCWNGSQLPSQIGIKSNTDMAAEIGKIGFLTFGPYVLLPEGQYSFTVAYKVSGEVGNVVALVDLASATKPIVEKGINLIPKRIGRNSLSFNFEALKQLPAMEIRVFSNGLTGLEIERVCIKKN